VTAVHHPVTWAAPRPLWSAGGGDRGLAPSILRFATDEFMDQLLGLLESNPNALSSHVAKYESWRSKQADLVTTDHVARTPLPAPVRKASLLTRLKPKGTAPASAAAAKPVTKQLKLYQPAHQRHYVVTATLACALPGLPDRKPAGPHEQLGFVVRRLLDGVEHAYVKGADGWQWQRLSGDDPKQLAPAEERLGVFPLHHQDGRGLRRSLWGGVVPVGKREEYLAASLSAEAPSLFAGQVAQLNPQPAKTTNDSKLARLAEFRMDVAEPWKAMVQSAFKAAAEIKADSDGDAGASAENRQQQLRERNWQYQTQSWLLMLDLMDFLSRHIEPVFRRINGQSATLNNGEQALFDWFSASLAGNRPMLMANGFAGAGNPLPFKSSMAAAMRDVSTTANRDRLEAMRLVYRANAGEAALWPEFHFLLAGISSIDGNGGNVACFVPFSDASTPNASVADLAEFAPRLNPLPEPPPGPLPAPADLMKVIDDLTVMVALAMPNAGDENARQIPFAMKLGQTIKQTLDKGERFVIRFVHLNADCGPTNPPTLSEPTDDFEMASFFDSDAPARPIRITLPMDTSPAGLRKHAKGTAFVLSDMLCGQVQRAKGLGFVDLVRQVLPWPLHKDIDVGDGGGCKSGGVDIGMICSISIPIITLCALILLMIIVSLLDFIFRWIPWFIMCFPVPGLKGKKPAGAT
jgi:hypothetical protein